MRRVAFLFVLAVFAPSLVLAWLAVSSLRDQQYVLERQLALVYQGLADRMTREAEDYLAERQREFAARVETLLDGSTPGELAVRFDDAIRKQWPFADVGFTVQLPGTILSPAQSGRPEARKFWIANSGFLANREPAAVFWNPPRSYPNVGQAGEHPATLAQSQIAPRPQQFSQATTGFENAGGQAGEALSQNSLAQNARPIPRLVNPLQQQFSINAHANPPPDAEPASKIAATETEFRQLVGDAKQGSLARFIDNQLKLMFWYRPPRDPQLVFGVQLLLPRLITELRPVIRVGSTLREEICVALLDEAARPVTVSHPDFQPASWRRPFVATEFGEALPHWEMAVYLRDPRKLGQSARTLALTVGLLVALLVLAIGVGGWLIVADLRRHLTLARQKTDFVSNVSHELKTPLTSIRMFSELLAEGRVTDAARQQQYLQIITAEAGRLTRLINNVLDFSRLDRGEKKYHFAPCDLASVVSETVATYRPHLEPAGFTLALEVPPTPAFVNGDRDALAQVLVNLLSNAEKYSGQRKEIRVEVRPSAKSPGNLEVRVLDRGLGVPAGARERIFEQFYRAHDSLSSGIQGSGLGLTLARQIARAHGGDVTCEPRDDGGSCFVLRVPSHPATPAPCPAG